MFTSQPLSHTVEAIINASPRQWIPYAIALVVGYPLLARSLRYRRVNRMLKKYNYPTRESMAKMTDEEAYQIQKQLGSFEFPFMFLKALQFALFRVNIPIFFSSRPCFCLSCQRPDQTKILAVRLTNPDIRHPINLPRSHKNNPILQPRNLIQTLHRHSRPRQRNGRKQSHLSARLRLPSTHPLPAQRVSCLRQNPRNRYAVHAGTLRSRACALHHALRVALSY